MYVPLPPRIEGDVELARIAWIFLNPGKYLSRDSRACNTSFLLLLLLLLDLRGPSTRRERGLKGTLKFLSTNKCRIYEQIVMTRVVIPAESPDNFAGSLITLYLAIKVIRRDED